MILIQLREQAIQKRDVKRLFSVQSNRIRSESKLKSKNMFIVDFCSMLKLIRTNWMHILQLSQIFLYVKNLNVHVLLPNILYSKAFKTFDVTDFGKNLASIDLNMITVFTIYLVVPYGDPINDDI